jgi:hypothetical protein
MKQTKQRKRHALRCRSMRRKRTLRGGSEGCLLPKNAKINWPSDDGCEDTKRVITILAGTKFDRFGGPYGSFVGKMKENGKPYSYNARAIPYIHLTNKTTSNSCKNTYNQEYPEYHLYEAVVDIPDVEECTAAPFNGHRGKAIQWKFKTSIKQLLKEKKIKEIPERPQFEESVMK